MKSCVWTEIFGGDRVRSPLPSDISSITLHSPLPLYQNWLCISVFPNLSTWNNTSSLSFKFLLVISLQLTPCPPYTVNGAFASITVVCGWSTLLHIYWGHKKTLALVTHITFGLSVYVYTLVAIGQKVNLTRNRHNAVTFLIDFLIRINAIKAPITRVSLPDQLNYCAIDIKWKLRLCIFHDEANYS